MDVKVLSGHAGILSRYFYDAIGDNSIGIKIFAIFLLLFQAIQINRLVSMNRLTEENSLFPGVFYLLLASCSMDFVPLHPVLLANTFIILMFMDIFRQTRNVQLHLDMFNVGMWIGLASLFFLPYIVFLLVAILSVIYLRTYKWIDTFRALLGVILPYFLLGTIVFLLNRFSDLWTQHFTDTFALLDFTAVVKWKNYVVIAVFALLILISLFMSAGPGGINIHVRKKLNTLFILLAGGLSLLLISADTGITHVLFVVFPLGVLIASIFLSLEKQFAEIMHLLLFSMALIFQYLV